MSKKSEFGKLALLAQVVDPKTGELVTVTRVVELLSPNTTAKHLKTFIGSWLICMSKQDNRDIPVNLLKKSLKITLPDNRVISFGDLDSLKKVTNSMYGAQVISQDLKDSQLVMSAVDVTLENLNSTFVPFSEIGQYDIKKMPTLGKAVGIDSIREMLKIEE